jgi:hypothetical protein
VDRTTAIEISGPYGDGKTTALPSSLSEDDVVIRGSSRHSSGNTNGVNSSKAAAIPEAAAIPKPAKETPSGATSAPATFSAADGADKTTAEQSVFVPEKASKTNAGGATWGLDGKRSAERRPSTSSSQMGATRSFSLGGSGSISLEQIKSVGGVRLASLLMPSCNSNSPNNYLWLEETLDCLAKNEAHSLGCRDNETGKLFTPVFFVMGACPNLFCGSMQAVMYCVGVDGVVDFWWVKPMKGSQTRVEQCTLSRNVKGPHKNDPGRSKPFYKPLADVFGQAAAMKDGWRFGIEDAGASADRAARAYVEKETSDGPDRMYLYLIWQEDWTNNPFARSKYIKGKIVYQRELKADEFFSRQYMITNGVMSLIDYEDSIGDSSIPGDEVKSLINWVPGQDRLRPMT